MYFILQGLAAIDALYLRVA